MTNKQDKKTNEPITSKKAQVAETIHVVHELHDNEEAHELPPDELLYDLADLFRLFADTTRIKILYALMDGEKSVAALADAVNVSQSAVSHQLRNLRQAHLVKFNREGKQTIYALSDTHVYTMLEQGMTHICE